MENKSALQTIPLNNLNELFNWVKLDKRVARNLQSRSDPISGKHWIESGRDFRKLIPLSKTNVPKTLYCHDLKGGYLQDRFHDQTICDNRPFVFSHWSCIDIFVYFAHHFITIPPLGWIEAAHKHGVLVLGTIITEWEAGSKLCSEILKDEYSMNKFVEKCTEIMNKENFDGWLFNIENEIPLNDIPKLVKLVEMLTKAVHQIKPEGQVIWYDSVIKDGTLTWQNELNEKNWDFFNVCDGIFLNYTWKSENLKQSLEILSCNNQEKRMNDIYVGVDVFGRGCIGGGGFQTNLAMEIVRVENNMSVALFAPSWTFEKAQEKDFSDFVGREIAFWRLLEKYMFFRGPKILKPTSSQIISIGVFYLLQESNNLEEESDATTKKWWLDLTRQEFQTTFFSFPCWPALELESKDPKTTTNTIHDSLDYNVFHQQKTQLLCIKQSKHGIIIPLLICQIRIQKRSMILLELDNKGLNCTQPIIGIGVHLQEKVDGDSIIMRELCVSDIKSHCIFKLRDEKMPPTTTIDCNNKLVYEIPDHIENIAAIGVTIKSQGSDTIRLKSMSIYQIRVRS